jgi:uncharacterized protein
MFQNYASLLPGGPASSLPSATTAISGGNKASNSYTIREADEEDGERAAYSVSRPSLSSGDGTGTNGETTAPCLNLSVLSADLPASTRLVAVRYFLDRPGYGLHNSAVRLWFDPPARARPQDVVDFLKEQQIALDGLLVEVYLDRFRSFMMLDACTAACIEWEFGDTSPSSPGMINVRLTDLGAADADADAAASAMMAESGGGTVGGNGAAAGGGFLPAPPSTLLATAPSTNGGGRPHEIANVSPLGLFAFSMTLGLECVTFLPVLVPGSMNGYFVLLFAPYAFFVSGLLQFVVGLFEVVRSNIYGATAFLGFGVFWMGNGLTAILQHYFAVAGTTALEMLAVTSPWFHVAKNVYLLAFSLMLLVQTFAMNRLSTILIALVSAKIFVSLFSPWSVGVLWTEFVLGLATSAFAFYVFAVEFTNQVYHREVLPVYKWSEHHSPGEAFGARGMAGTLQSKATKLRLAHFVSPRTLREAQAEKATAAVTFATAAAAAPVAGQEDREKAS